jgi:thiol-disulfide isomerase/thioredoxin
MRRWTGSLLAALLVALPLMAADKDKDDKGNDRATQFKELKGSFEKARREAIQAYQAAKTDKEKEAAFEKYQNPGDQVAKVLKLVEAKPTDDLSLDMLQWAFQASQGQNAKVYDLLAEHHVKSEKVKNICLMLSSTHPEAAKKFLQKVLDENPDKDIKGYACYDLAELAADKADKGGTADKDASKSASAEAEKLYERVEKDFGEVKLGRQNLGDLAKGGLFAIRNLTVGKKAPNVESENLDGKKVQLKDYKGKVVVLDIWATWCGPCRAMIPHEREMVKKLKDKSFALISVSADAKKETLTDFLKSTEMPWDHWWNGQTGGIVKDWNVKFFPTIYVLDSEGVIRYKHIRGKELEDAVEKLLAEAKEKK